MPVRSYSFYEKLCRSLITVILILLILYVGQHIFIPLAFGCLFALLLISPCSFFEKAGIGRGVAALISTLLFLFSGFIILYFISSQVVRFKNDIPVLIDQLTMGFDELVLWVQHKFHLSASSMDEFLHSITLKTFSSTSSFIGITVNTLSGTIVYLILIPIYTFLLLYYRSLVVNFLIRSFNEVHTARVLEVLHKIRYVIKGYITGLFIEMVIVAIMNCLGFFILGVKYAVLLSVLAAVLNVIPYLGIFTACILSLLITSTTNTPATVAGVAIVLLCVHLIDANIILPKVVGSKVKINVLATILAVLTGSALWGIPGMFLAIPMIAVLKVIFDAVEELQPWGLLLGEGKNNNVIRNNRYKRNLKKLLGTKK